MRNLNQTPSIMADTHARQVPLVLAVDDCHAAYDSVLARGVEITQKPVEHYDTLDAGFCDPLGNGCKLIRLCCGAPRSAIAACGFDGEAGADAAEQIALDGTSLREQGGDLRTQARNAA